MELDGLKLNILLDSMERRAFWLRTMPREETLRVDRSIVSEPWSISKRHELVRSRFAPEMTALDCIDKVVGAPGFPEQVASNLELQFTAVDLPDELEHAARTTEAARATSTQNARLTFEFWVMFISLRT